ncbi:MAG: hypothetical protein JWM78_1410 [Verrucomicrobiaceae bacterium]|nr:hypothetical protein [Verrucomicrobiaceae bacterium]
MHNKKTIFLWRSFFALALVCASVTARADSVEIDYDTNADFSRFNYYQWQDQSDNLDGVFATLSDTQVRDALTPSIEGLALLATPEHSADFLVRYFVREQKKVVDDRPRIGIGIGSMGNNVGGGFSFSLPLGGDNLDKQAHVIVDLLDPKTQKLLWRGSLLTGISSSSPEINQRQIQKAGVEILKKFPPR